MKVMPVKLLLLFSLKFLMIVIFYLAVASNKKPFRVHHPHLVGNTDTQYLVDQH